MGDTFIISGLREKRSAVAGQIVDMRRQIDKLQADLFHIDSVLKLYGLEPDEIPTKGRMPVRSAFFGRNEISRRCRDMLREADHPGGRCGGPSHAGEGPRPGSRP